jgi:pimeloyl-ACP methyl ester carboxylesterase
VADQSTLVTAIVEARITVAANGLEHRLLEWPASAQAFRARRGPTVVLVHGYMDAAGTWDRVAPHLAAAGFRVLAPDMRGFGDGPRAPTGSYYHFADYVFDLADLVDALSPDEPVALVGHSMGGTIATLFAGAFPERVARVALLEGLGPPDNDWTVGPVRMRAWIDGARKARAREAERGAPTFTLEEAHLRLAANHPGIPRDVLAHRLPHLVREVSPGRFAWTFDPLHRTTAPVPFFAKLFIEFARKVSCSVLAVSGGARGFHPPDEAERLAAFRDLASTEIPDAGHMMHWTRPDDVGRAIVAFLQAPDLA